MTWPGTAGRAIDGPGSAGDRDRGAVTAELALALPAVVLVLALLLVTVGGLTAKLRCADAARGAARVAALGQTDGEIAAVAQRIAGPGSTITVTREPPWVEVTVAASVPGDWFSGANLGLSASATAWAEP